MAYYFNCSALEMVDGKEIGIVPFGFHSAYNDFDRHRNWIKEKLKAELYGRHPNSRIDVVLLQPIQTTVEELHKAAKTILRRG